jgi:hypothetical protein
MPKYATGKHSKAISDRSGLEFPYREMVREWNGSLVHFTEFEPKQPQLQPRPSGADAISLRHVRPDRIENDVPYSIPENGFETYSSGSRIINVTAPGHGLTNGTTYRFRGAPLAVTVAGGTFQFAKAAGYAITTGLYVSDARNTSDYSVANFFHFTVDTDTATIGGVKGGGVGCSIGPVTLSA